MELKRTASLFESFATSEELFKFTSYRELLARIYQDVKNSLTHYSYTDFAVDLGFPSSNTLWLFITGRRKLSPKATERITQAIGWKGRHRRYFLTLVKHNNANDNKRREELFAELLAIRSSTFKEEGSQNELEFFTEWYIPVIHEMVALPFFDHDPQWIANQLYLKILPKQARHAIEVLEKLQLIAFDKKTQRYARTDGSVLLGGDYSALAMVRYHENICELAREAVTRVPAQRRYLHGLTVCLNDSKFEKLKKLLKELSDLILELESQPKEPSASTYQVNLQIFNLIKPKP